MEEAIEKTYQELNKDNKDKLKNLTTQCLEITGGSPECISADEKVDYKKPKEFKKWHVHRKVSPIDDSENVYLTLRANDTYYNKYGKKVTPMLRITCQENKTNLAVIWKTFLGTQNKKITHRIDKEEAISSYWDISNDYEAVIIRKPMSFIRNLLDKKRLFVEITPHAENSINAVFEIEGLNHAISNIQNACNWD